ncbi:MAG TPA: NAD(P)H-dependent oxidoreductase [Povalibacter sp.]|nr:NAD(P)H-dependent oxidoreductase [Povalibacter sp.]
MNSLIVLAHPEAKSYNAALANATQQALSARGHDVRLSDLYAQSFAPDEHARHFSRRADSSRFDAQTEQRFSANHGILPADVRKEVGDLLWADLLVLQFPLWWFGMPAILKGWMDRIFLYGTLYSSKRRLHAGVCAGKRAILSVTAGSSKEACAPDGQEGDTRLILWPIHYSLHYVGFTVLEPAIITGVRGGRTGADGEVRQRELELGLHAHKELFANIDSRPTIAFNGAADWDECGKLRPGAPVHSPFIRHRGEVLSCP